MNIFKRLAVVFVTAYANRLYRKAVRIADRRHAQEHRMIYVACNTLHPELLSAYDHDSFKAEKKLYGHLSRLMTLQTLKNGCYYHTPDTAGNQRMSDAEKERRRLHFIRVRLKKAKLL